MTQETGDGASEGPASVERAGADATLDAVAAAVGEGVCRLDADGRFETVSDDLVDLVGYDRGELVGERLQRIVAEGDVEAVERTIRSLRDGVDGGNGDRPVGEVATSIRTAAGDLVPCEFRVAAVGADGRFDGVAGVLRVASGNGRPTAADRDRSAREVELDEALDRVSDAFFAVDAAGRFTYVNERAGELLEREPEALVGTDVVDELHGTEETPFVEEVLRALETGEQVTFEEFYPPTSRWFGVRLYPGETGVSVYFRDVTEERRRESALEQYETVVEAVDDGLYAVDEDYRFTLVNDAYCRLTGYDREELLGQHISMVVDESTVEEATALREALRREDGDRRSGSVEMEIERADGERVTVESRYVLLQDEEAFRGTVGVVRDVSGRKAFEETLTTLHEASRELHAAETDDDVDRIVMETATDVLDLSAATLFRYDEGAHEMVPAARTAGAIHTDQELPRLPVDGSLTGHVLQLGEFRAYDDVRETPYVDDPVTEMRAGLFAPVGDDRVLVVSATEPGAFDERDERLVEILAGNAAAAIERHERERELRESERRYRTLVEHFPNGAVALYDEECHYVAVGGEMYDRIDLSPDDAIGLAVSDRLSGEIVDALESVIQRAFEGESEEAEVTYDGRDFWLQSLPIRDGDGDVILAMVVTQDVTERREYERELERYRSIVETVGDGVYVLDDEGRFAFVNEAFAELAEYDPDELIGADVSTVTTGEYAETIEEEVRRLDRGAVSVGTVESAVVTAGGERIPVEARFTRFQLEEGTYGRVGTVRDITERKERERELAEQRERYRGLVESAPVAIATYDADGSITYVNDAGAELAGADDPDDVVGRSAIEFIHPDDRAEAAERMRQVVEDREPAPPRETKLVDLGGDVRYAILASAPVTSGGEPGGQVVLSDVTKRKEYERRLSESERRYRTLAEHFPNGLVALYDEDLRFELVEGQLMDEWEGVSSGDLEGVPAAEVLSAEHRDDLEPALRAAFEGETSSVEVESDGRTFAVWTTPILDDGGEVIAGLSFAMDVTDRKERERQLERFERIVETVDDGVYVLDGDGDFVLVNQALVEMTDYDREELIGAHASKVLGERFDEIDEEMSRELRSGERDLADYEEEIYTAGGETITVESRFTLFDIDGELGRVGVVRDISERKAYERRLERFRTMIETVDDGVYTIDSEGYITMANAAYAEMVGYHRDDLIGLHASELVDETVHERAREIEAELAEGDTNTARLAADLKTADGSTVTAEATFALLPGDDEDYERVAVVRDITERVEREAELEWRDRTLRRIYEVISDTDLSFSERVDDLLNVVQDAIGTSFGTFSHIDDDRYIFEEVVAPPGADLEAGHTVPIEELPICRSVAETAHTLALSDVEEEEPGLADPTWGISNYVGAPVFGRDGVYGTFCFYGTEPRPSGFTDWEVTLVELLADWVSKELQREQRNAELERALDLLHHTEDVADVGGWELDPETMEVYWTEELFDILGVPHDEEPPLTEALDAVYHEEDRAIVEEALEEALETGEPFDVEARFVSRGGDRPRWARIQGIPQVEDDEVVSLRGAFQDITERVEREAELERTLDLLERTEDIADVGGWEIDPETQEIFWTENTFELQGIPPGDEPPMEEALDVYHPEDRRIVEEALEEALEAGEPIDLEVRYVPVDGDDVRWFRIMGVPEVEDGEVVSLRGAAQDVTERVERERELEQFEVLFKESTDVNAVLDEEGAFEYVTPSAEHVLGYDQEALVGEEVFEFIHPDDRGAVMEEFAAVVEDPDYRGAAEFRFQHADGSWVVLEGRGRNLLDEPVIGGVVAYTRDVTELKERERELRERVEQEDVVTGLGTLALEEPDLERLFDRATDLVAETLDNDLCKLLELRPDGDTLALRAGYGWDEGLVGSVTLGTGDDSVAGRTLETEEAIVVDDLQAEDPVDRPELLTDHGGRSGVSVIVGTPRDPWGVLGTYDTDVKEFSRQDVNFVQSVANILGIAVERASREAELRRRVEQQQVVTDLGKRALSEVDLDRLFDEAVERVAETLDNEYAKVLELQPGGESLLLRAGVGWRDGLVGEGTVGTGDDSQAGHTIRSEEPIVVTDLATEERFSGPELLTSHGVVSGVSTVIGPPDDPWGVLGTHDTERREFSRQDVNFVQSVANILATAIDRRTREREIEDQRNRMAAVVRLSEIVQEVDQAVIRQSSREEIDRLVCENLVESGEYGAAWIGDVNLSSERVSPRAVAGVPDELVEEQGFDSTGEGDQLGPTASAAASGETGVARAGADAADPESATPFPTFAGERGYRSMAAVPLAFEDVRYGVLTLFSTREDAFEGYELTILEHLGRTVGHAINAIDRKQALVGDSFTELEVRLPGVIESLDLSGEPGGTEHTITVEGTVPAGGDTVVQYLTVTGLSPEGFREAAAGMPAVEEVRRIGDDGTRNRYEVTYSEPPISSTLASYGGRIESIAFDVPDLRVTVALPTSADVRQIVGSLRSEFPDVKIDAQRTVTREGTSTEEYRTAIEDALTERQRTALMSAFFAGYFEWSRESTGEEVAETLGVSPSTFHQHLRAAQRKVFATLFENEQPV